MRNLKKIIAVAVTLVMLLSVAVISASAADAPTLALYGKSTTAPTGETGMYYELAVHLTDATNKVGGIEGTITYNKDVFTFVDVVLNANFMEAGNEDADSVVADNGAGTIKFVGLNDADSVGEWFVVRFTAVAGKGTFTLAARGANTENYVDVTVKDSAEISVVDEDILKVEGATIKLTNKTDRQDIKFNVVADADLLATKYANKNVVEYGVMMMFTKRLGYRELTYKMVTDNEYGLAVAKVSADTLCSFTANLNNMTPDALGVRVSARAYVKLEGDTIIYSNNFNLDKNTKSGYASKSVIDVARLAALGVANDTNDADGSIRAMVQNSAGIFGENRTKLLDFISANCKAA